MDAPDCRGRVCLVRVHPANGHQPALAHGAAVGAFVRDAGCHVYGEHGVPRLQLGARHLSIARNIDIAAIYTSMATALVADAALLSNDFSNVPFQTMADPIITAGALIFFFAIRRMYMPKCRDARLPIPGVVLAWALPINHSDLEHAGLRASPAPSR